MQIPGRNSIKNVKLPAITEKASEKSSSVNSEGMERKEFILVLDLDETLVHYKEDHQEGKVYFRPFVDVFLKEMNKFYNIMIFTAALQEYADVIIDHLDPEKKIIQKRFYRKDTMFLDGDYSVKDLTKISQDLSKIILIDNLPDNFKKQSENGIFIKSWYNDENDRALLELVTILKDLIHSGVSDVRQYLNRYKKKLIQNIQRGSLNPAVHL